MERERAGTHEIGAPRRRVEDPRFLRGEGRFVDDLRLPGILEVAFVRSTHAHARIEQVDLSAARAADGVVGAWTGAELAPHGRPPVRSFYELNITPLPPLAVGKVVCVGYPVAAVVARDRYLARDATGLANVAYAPLPAVTTVEQALAPDAPLLYPELGTNLAFRVTREGGDVDGAFARAPRRLAFRVRHSRVAQAPLEPRGIVASYDRATDLLTVWRSTQVPFQNRAVLSTVLGRPESSIRVIASDVGGAFGSKMPLYPDELTVCLLALRLGSPLRWVSTRAEDFAQTMQGRDHADEAEVAFGEDGIVAALRTRSRTNFGCATLSYTPTPPARIPTYGTGAYHIPAFRAELVTAYTNTTPTGPYRGAGRPEAALIAERTMDEVARALGMDPAEVRRRNFIRPDEFPYTTPNGAVYDSGDYEKALDRVLELAGYAELREEQRPPVGAGSPRPATGGETPPLPVRTRAMQIPPLRGIGLATTVELGAQGWESGAVEVEPDGTIVARTGASPHGQGQETSFAQVLADRFEVPFERIRVVHGDTAHGPEGFGTSGSRSMALGCSALVFAADEVKRRAVEVAATLLEAEPADLVYEAGAVRVAGAPTHQVNLSEIAAAALQGIGCPPGQPGLRHEHRFDPGRDTVSFAALVAVVEVDPETGRVRLERLIGVDDCGVVINPLIVEGQIHGSLAQGIGQALYERIVYGDDGQLLTASLLDYALPTAGMLPAFELEMVETPSPVNPLGAKGVGESGCVSAPAAIVNAVLDALAPLGVREVAMPLTPARVWEAL